jgi:dienelactone hydrolase
VAEVLLLHHAQGRTPGVLALADVLRDAGHVVHVPDLYDGRTFATLDDGVAHAGDLGFGEVLARAARTAKGLPDALVYAGMSLGVLPAQQLAQTRAGARGAVLLHACVPVSELGPAWPAGVPVLIHAMEGDPVFVGEGDAEAARQLVAASPDAELFLYPGDRHLFADASLPSYDAGATATLIARVLDLLARC